MARFKNGVERRKALVTSLKRSEVDVNEWAEKRGVEPRKVRQDIDYLRRQGNKVRAVGEGRFTL